MPPLVSPLVPAFVSPFVPDTEGRTKEAQKEARLLWVCSCVAAVTLQASVGVRLFWTGCMHKVRDFGCTCGHGQALSAETQVQKASLFLCLAAFLCHALPSSSRDPLLPARGGSVSGSLVHDDCTLVAKLAHACLQSAPVTNSHLPGPPPP